MLLLSCLALALLLLVGGTGALLLQEQPLPATETAKLSNRKDLRKLGRAEPSLIHEVMIITRQRNLTELHNILMDVSDPTSSSYGQYLSRFEIADMTVEKGLPSKIISTLKSLASEGEFISTQVESFGDYVIARAPIHTWERILSTKFYHFNRIDSYGRPLLPVVRALQYTVPAQLVPLVESIQHTVQFPSRSKPKWNSPLNEIKRRSRPNLQCNTAKFDSFNPPKHCKQEMSGFVTPARLNEYYKIGSNKGSPLASQGIYESDQQNYSPVDLLTFQNTFHVSNKTHVHDIGKYNVSKVCDERATAGQCGEANLDIQYMTAISQDTPTWYIAQNGNSTYDQDFWMVIFLRTLMNMTSPPLVNSVSYGSQEPGQSVSSIYAFETAALKLAVMGVTLVISAGDDGVHDSAARAGSQGSMLCGYSASYPATSMYVVAVGAVQGPESRFSNSTPYYQPSVCSGLAGGVITGGGGFSAYIDMPAWQKATVDQYFAGLAPWQRPAPGYNYPGGNTGPVADPVHNMSFPTAGRAYPDVALLGFNYVTFQNKTPGAVSGTSASAPTFAAMVSLVNAARLERGLPSVGWITKLIWDMGAQPASYPNKFITSEFDVTVGNNKCTATDGNGNVTDTCQSAFLTTCCAQGFYATPGWDPASGWGGVDFTLFKNYFLNLAMPTRAPSTYPTPRPSNPTRRPTARPTRPTTLPTAAPSHPTKAPTAHPTKKPNTARPTLQPIAKPTRWPTRAPISFPTPIPGTPTALPTVKPLLCPAFSAPAASKTDLAQFATCGIYACPGQAFNVSTCPEYLGAKTAGNPSLFLLSDASVQLESSIIIQDPVTKVLCAELFFSATLPCQVYQLKEGCEPHTGACHGTAAVLASASDIADIKIVEITPRPSAAPTLKKSADTFPAHTRRNLLSTAGELGATEKAIFTGRADLQMRERANPATPHTLVFALQEKNLDTLRAKHVEISDPNSDEYMNQMSKDDVVALTVDPAHEEAVRALLSTLGVTNVRSSYFQSHVHATAPLAVWESLLSATFYVYDRTDVDGNALRSLIRATEYTIPEALRSHVVSVHNTVQMPMPVTRKYKFQIGSFAGTEDAEKFAAAKKAADTRPASSLRSHRKATTATTTTATTASSPHGIIFPNTGQSYSFGPSFISGAYFIADNTGYQCTLPDPSAPAPNHLCPSFDQPFGQAVFASLDQSYSPIDLDMFQDYLKLPNAGQQIYADYGGHNGTFEVDGYVLPWPQYDICKESPSSCGEANLDVQYLTSISEYTPTYFIYQNATNSLFSDFLTFVDSFTTQAIPWVISISYGGPEAGSSTADMRQFDLLATKMGVAGTTIVVASGDDGAPGTFARSNQLGDYGCTYTPDYPGSAPSVLAVGATRGPETGYPEVVCQSNGGPGITSSGGFSDFFQPLPYQTQYIASYFKTLQPWQEPYPGYNKAGRGYPDVAVMGHNYIVIDGQAPSGADGTSASAPVFAAMLSLINAYRMQQTGKNLKPLGFINPFLYQYQSHFQNDVKQGSNHCAEGAETLLSGYIPGTQIPAPSPTLATFVTAASCCAQGYYAAAGWDPVSGIGSVNYASLLSMLKTDEYVTKDRKMRRALAAAAATADADIATAGVSASATASADDKAPASSSTATAPKTDTTKKPLLPPIVDIAAPRTTSLASRPDIVHMRRAPPNLEHEISVWLEQVNLEAMYDELLAMSDPTGPRYGEAWWTREKIAAFTSLPMKDNQTPAQRAEAILVALGATSTRTSRYGEYVYATAPIAVWEKHLKAEFNVYKQLHRDGSVSKLVVRCLQYSMPAELQGLARHIFRTVQFPMMHFTRPAISGQGLDAASAHSAMPNLHYQPLSRAARSELSQHSRTLTNRPHKDKPVLGVNVTSMILPGYVTPALLWDYYNIKATSHSAGKYGTVAVFEADNQTVSTNDLKGFEALFNITAQTISLNHVIGKHYNASCPGNCMEANLDVQYISAIVQDVDFYYIYSDDFMDGLLAALDVPDEPISVVSISYGAPENIMDPSDLDRFLDGSFKHSMAGTTFVISSGDDGAPGSNARAFGNPANPGSAGGSTACTYISQFPASCPFVVAAGASRGPETPGSPEVVCQGTGGGLVTSGGGFSQYYAMPAFQTASYAAYQAVVATSKYSQLAPMDGYKMFVSMVGGINNQSTSVGRGYPDVAMLGYNYLTVQSDIVEAVSGTSASAPVFAALVVLANSRRIKQGKKSLGYITAALYAPSAQPFLRDITHGDNLCTSTQTQMIPGGSTLAYATCCAQGFHATPGWDPTTGWGSIRDFEAFASYFLSYTFPPTMYPTPSPFVSPAPTLTPDELFLKEIQSLGGGAVFAIVFFILVAVGILVSVCYMYRIGTLRKLSLASFSSWAAFKALFKQPGASYYDGDGDVIPSPGTSNPVRSNSTASNFGGFGSTPNPPTPSQSHSNSFAGPSSSLTDAELEMRESGRESSFLSTSFAASNSANSRL